MSVLVVGGEGAIGRAVVTAVRQDGDPVYVLDRVDGVDAADYEQVAEYVQRLPTPPARLAHVAGSVGYGGLLDTSPSDWKQVVDDSLTSSFAVTRAVIPGMVARGRGAIVLMSSINARNGGNSLSGPAYSAAKAGVLALTRNIAKEYGRYGIRINAVAPGPVRSPMTERLSTTELASLIDGVPLGRVGEPHEIASLIAFLLSDSASYITGCTVDINGGAWVG